MRSQESKVLIVDDDLAMLRLLAKWLENAGYQARTASSAREAIASIEADCPGVLVTDWEMPEMDGLELCRWLRCRDLPRYVYTLLLTVRTGTNDIVNGLEAGADDFLKKPVDRHELLARLRSGSRVLELETRLSENARRDSLTGLLTQRAFFEQLHVEWKRSRRYRTPLSCAMLDIDFFKRINDTHGHAVGDRAIRGVATTLQHQTRESDVISRYGGEEFCVMLPETCEQQALLWAERVRRVFEETSLSLTGASAPFTVSIGIAQAMDDTRSPEHLVDMADQALLVAKRAGRNRTVGFQAVCEAGASSPRTPERLLRGMIARDVMIPIVAGLHCGSSIERAAGYFLHFRLGSAPVVDDEGTLVGMLSDRDLLESMLQEHQVKHTVREIMDRNVIWYDESTPLLTIYSFLHRVSLRSLVIVSNRRPVGIISRSVILRWCNNLLRSENESGSAAGAPPMSGGAVIQTAETLVAEAQRIRDTLQSDFHASLPCVIGGASRLQELTNDLLALAHSLQTDSLSLMRPALPDLLVGVEAIS